MVCLQIRVIGFGKEASENSYSLCVDVNEKVSYVLEYLQKNFNIVFDLDEVMVLCNDKQIYIDEPIPEDCSVLTVFPLALGGLM